MWSNIDWKFLQINVRHTQPQTQGAERTPRKTHVSYSKCRISKIKVSERSRRNKTLYLQRSKDKSCIRLLRNHASKRQEETWPLYTSLSSPVKQVLQFLSLLSHSKCSIRGRKNFKVAVRSSGSACDEHRTKSVYLLLIVNIDHIEILQMPMCTLGIK